MKLRLYTLWCVLWLVTSVVDHASPFFAIATIATSMALATRGAIRHQERQTLNRHHRLLAQRDQDRARRSQFLAQVKAESLPAHEVQLDVSNPTSVIRQRLESGGLYVPLGTCRCAAYPRPHQHAKTPLHSAPAQHHVVRPAVKPCTEGGPCRAADREIIYDGLGNRAASRCSRCEKERYWLPYVTGK